MTVRKEIEKNMSELLEVLYNFVLYFADPTYFPKRCAHIFYNGNVIGKMGILHPQIVKEFDLNMPCSALEINIEPFL